MVLPLHQAHQWPVVDKQHLEFTDLNLFLGLQIREFWDFPSKETCIFVCT